MASAAIVNWMRRLLAVLAGVLLLLILLAGIALAVLDSGDLKRVLVWGADRYLDASLQINGEFSLSLGRETTLVAEQVLLKAHNGSYSVTAGSIRIGQRLGSYLRTGTLWINSLQLVDIRTTVQEQQAAPLLDLGSVKLPPVVIEQATLRNLEVIQRLPATGASREFNLQELVIDDVNNAGPVGIRGQGMINGQPLAVNGELGPLADLFNAKPYTIKLDVTSGTLAAHISGSIIDPVVGKGMDLVLTLEDPSLSQTLQLFDSSVPDIGALKLRARLHGDYDRPGLDAIDIRLQHGSELGASVGGSVADLSSGKGLELNFDGHCKDPEVFSWLLSGHDLQVERLAARGSVHEQSGLFLLSGMETSIRTRRGLEVHAGGAATIPTELHPRPKTGQALQVSFTAPSSAAIGLAESGVLAIPGKVSGSADLRPYRDGAGLSMIKVQAGDDARLRLALTGSVALIPYARLQGFSGVDMEIDLRAADSASLGQLLDLKLPELGLVHASTQARGDSDDLLLDDITVTAGPLRSPVVRAGGQATLKPAAQTSTLQLDFDITVAELVAALTGRMPEDLGRLQGTLGASEREGGWRLDRFNVLSTQTSLYIAHFSGAVDDATRRDKARIDVVIDIPDPPALGKALDLNPGQLASYHAEGSVTFDNKALHYRGEGRLGRTRSTTVISGSLAGDKPVLQGSFTIPVLYLADFGLQPALPPATKVRKNKHHLQKPAAPIQPVFSREPLDFAWLDWLNLDLAVDIEQIESREINADQLQGRVLLQDGRLQVKPMRLIAEGGPSDLELEIDARGTPAISLKLSANDQKLGRWIAQVQNDIPVDGFCSYDIDLQGRGRSPHELASSLGGSVGLAFENARIPSVYVEYLSIDVFGWVLSKAVKEKRYADINCVLAKFDVKDGIMKSTLLASDGPNLSMEGRLTLDLGNETIDAVLLPKQKKTLFAEITPVKITGDMQDPHIHAIPATEAVARIGSLILVPYVAIPVTLLGKLWTSLDDHDDYGGGCAALKVAKDAAGKDLPAVDSPGRTVIDE